MNGHKVNLNSETDFDEYSKSKNNPKLYYDNIAGGGRMGRKFQ